MFLDEAIIHVRGGAGGNGCVSFRREKFIPRGGPNGGDGGRGGSVFLQADPSLTSLMDLSRQAAYFAEGGRHGSGNNRAGRDGRDLVIAVPLGTLVRVVPPKGAPREGAPLGEILEPGQRLVAARGGKGGRGNKAFATSTHQVPRRAEEGTPGEDRRLYLELKLLADVGLIGLPNAGKSTLLSRLSRASPKIADYPFTTLTPHLGIAEIGGFQRLVVADIPGLIEGAHAGHGLGLEFLRHVERTSVLVHLVSVEAGSAGKMLANFRIIEKELAAYSLALAAKPRLVVASKVDLFLPLEWRQLADEFARGLGLEVQPLSAVTGEGLPELLQRAARLLRGGDQGLFR